MDLSFGEDRLAFPCSIRSFDFDRFALYAEGQELIAKVGDGARSSSYFIVDDALTTITEFDTRNDFWQLVFPIQPTLGRFSRFNKPENIHKKRHRETSLRTFGPIPGCCKDTLNEVGCFLEI